MAQYTLRAAIFPGQQVRHCTSPVVAKYWSSGALHRMALRDELQGATHLVLEGPRDFAVYDLRKLRQSSQGFIIAPRPVRHKDMDAVIMKVLIL